MCRGKIRYAVIDTPSKNTVAGILAAISLSPREYKAQIQYQKDGTWWYIELLPETVVTVCFEP